MIENLINTDDIFLNFIDVLIKNFKKGNSHEVYLKDCTFFLKYLKKKLDKLE